MGFASLQFVMDHFNDVMAALATLLMGIISIFQALIVICMLIPGEQPEKFLQGGISFLQKGVDFIKRFSRK